MPEGSPEPLGREPPSLCFCCPLLSRRSRESVASAVAETVSAEEMAVAVSVAMAVVSTAAVV